MVDKNDLEVVRMKKVLVIGSAVVDVVIHLPHLPEKSEDVHVTSQKMSLGGCAYNASDTIRHFKVPYIPFFPVGTGAYGDFVRNALAERGIVSPVPKPETENGCCYCFVEDDGERTFACYHGAEYRFQKEWFDALVLLKSTAYTFAVWRLKKRPERISFLIWRSIRSLPYFLLRVRESHCWIQSGWNGFLPCIPFFI